MATLLIVEDDVKTNDAICEYMKSAGHETIPAYDGAEAFRRFQDEKPDLVVLDIMLPKVCYAYEKGREILSNVHMELETGKLYAILGPSGSGKTTLLALLGGLDTPTQGSVLFGGEDIKAKGLENHRRNHISLIFQSYNLIDYITPLENVRLTARLDADTAEEITAVLKEGAHAFGKCVVVVWCYCV